MKHFTKLPSMYISAADIEYYYWIFANKSQDARKLAEGRTSSLSECNSIVKEYKRSCGSSCVITVKELGGTGRWICRRADSAYGG